MKKKFEILMFLMIASLVSAFTLSGCKKDGIDENQLPKITTVNVMAVSHSFAVVKLVIQGVAGAPVTEAGIMLASSKKIKAITPFNEADYSVYIEKLEPNTTYIVKPYATNAKGTHYGE